MAALSQTIAARQVQSQNLGLGAALAPSLQVLALGTAELADMLADAALSNPFLDVLPPRTVSHAIPATFDDAAPLTLADHLGHQIARSGAAAPVAACARAIAASLEARGRLPDPDGLRALLPFPDGTFDAALALVRSLSPAGLAARDLRDCLSMQLAERKDASDAVLLLDHLDLVARGERVRLARLLSLPLERLGAALGVLRELRPDPSAGFGVPYGSIAPPDVIVRKAASGHWSVTVNDDAMPRIQVGTPPARTVGAEAYVDEMINEARMLASALTRRSVTLFRVANEVVRRQEAFLAHGRHRLEPLLMRDVAATLDLHESTVSRAVHAKSIELPDGQMPLRDLFQPDIAGHAPAAIRERVRAIVESHREPTPLRDLDIAQALERDGINIARRTVAKYRARLGLAASDIRARAKREPIVVAPPG